MSSVRPGPEKIVIVSGDMTLDWNFARAKGSQRNLPFWDVDASFNLHMRPGGSALLAELLGEVAEGFRTEFRGYNNWRVVHADIAAATRQNDGGVHHSYAVWSLFKHDEKTPPERPDSYVWRVKDFLGLKRATDSGPLVEKCWSQVAGEVANASLIVLDDAALGFRQSPQVWGEALKRGEAAPWILLKMTRPVADGALWNYLHEHWADRLIAVIPVNDLRLGEARISRELSWERAAQDIVWELEYSPHLKKLSDCAHVVISFDTVGAVIVSRAAGMRGDVAGTDPIERSLVFDPRSIEGMWMQDYPGGVIGYTTCLVAGIARQCMLSPESPSVKQGAKDGLAAMRLLHQGGYVVKDDEAGLDFPVQGVVGQLSSDSSGPFADSLIEKPTRYLEQLFASVAAPAARPPGGARPWSILHEQDSAETDDETSYLRNLAKRIVRLGPKAVLKTKPLGEFRKLLTADRQEVENYRSIRALIGEYSRQTDQSRPLSIAVFGPPGSGKSFGITEVAESVLPGRIKKLTFNLSQLSSPTEIFSALHQVRDVALSGSLPLVFWDEFDTSLDGRALGWLRYFLSPMQDGQFQQGEVTHPIGPAIFVFAGGTSDDREGFGKKLNEGERKAAKVPDFISRLKGYVNILGPNPRGKDPAADPDYIIRRAILLRSFLEKYALHIFQPPDRKGRLQIDSGVLRAFLSVPHYEHGARSMESIIAMSFLTGKTRFERSALPSESQLDLHVQGRTFLALVQQIMAGDYDQEDAEEAAMKERDDEIVELLARAVHEHFCNERRAEGIIYGEVTNYNATPKTHCSLKPFEQLPLDEQLQNRNNARDIPRKLAFFKYAMTPARSNEPPFEFPPDELETLARKEQERWEREKRRAGWHYGPDKDFAKLEHPDLLPWTELTREQLASHEFYRDEPTDLTGRELSETAKQKNRETVAAIPKILARVGFTIVKIDDVPAELGRKEGEPAEPESESAA